MGSADRDRSRHRQRPWRPGRSTGTGDHAYTAPAVWTFRGQQRPDFADEPGDGQESVWDYPRPPVVVAADRRVRIAHGGRDIATSHAARRVLETASPPAYYLPVADIDPDALVPVAGSSWCEWKGAARYFALADGGAEPVAFAYDDPTSAFEAIAGWISFYPGRVECYLDDERVRPQPGGFYAGWITDDIVGPVKGEPGTGHW